jgi:hypothetical protein
MKYIEVLLQTSLNFSAICSQPSASTICKVFESETPSKRSQLMKLVMMVGNRHDFGRKSVFMSPPKKGT